MVCPSCLAENATGTGVCSGCGEPLRVAEAIRRGTVLAERYEVVSHLGKGGMGEVYKARDRVLDEPVAIKVLLSAAVMKREMVQRFRDEVKLARRVRHRNVCAIHNYDEDRGVLFIAMELVAGEDLRQRLAARGKLPPAEAYDVALQIAEGLEAIHEAGVIHRDLKPANIMLDPKGVVRLMDFGIAREWGAKAGLTATGKIIGTPEYMSPEQIRAQPLDFRSDVYSLGIVVFELFTGRLPFLADSPVDTIMKQLKEPPPLDTPGVLPALVPVLSRALDKTRDRRHPSVADFATDLRRASADTPPLPVAAPVAPEAATQRLSRPAEPAQPSRPEFPSPAAPRSSGPRSLAEASGWNLKIETEETAPPEVRALIAELRSDDATKRSRAAQSLGEQGAAAAGAVGALMEAVRDPVPFVRSAAAFALKRVRTR